MKKSVILSATIFLFFLPLSGSSSFPREKRIFYLNEDLRVGAETGDDNLIFGSIASIGLDAAVRNDDGGKKYLEVLKSIYSEVKELGAYPGENFIRREFFIGAEDDDDTYKDVHVSILIQGYSAQEKMKVRVTQMEPGQGDPRVKYAGISKTLVCLIGEENVELESSDFKEKEIDALVPDILRAVRNKKKLLSLYGSGRRG